MAYSDSFPATRPVFQSDFANGGRIDPRITFSRSDTPPTYAAPSAVHYWSNEKHLSSENLLTYSSDISQSVWTKDQVTETGGQSAPDGGTDAYKLTENSATNEHRIYISTSSVGSASLTFSAYLKYIGRQWVRVRLTDSGGTDRHVWFDIQNGTKGTEDSGMTGTIAASGGGYYKITATISNTVSSGTYLVIGGASGDGNVSYAGSGADAFAVWGMNLSTTGQSTLNATSGQIHREYAPTLKSVSYAGQPRFEYSPTDSASEAIGSSRGLLIEGQVTNLQRYGSDFSSWSNKTFLGVESNQSIAPNGNLEADLLIADASYNPHYIYDNTVSVTAGTAHTFSMYLKDAGQRYVQICGLSSLQTSGAVNFDLQTGTASASGAHTGTITAVGNGWYRATVTTTSLFTATTGFLILAVDSISSGRVANSTGDGYKGFLAWGAQQEASSFASSLVDTGTGSSALTRASDSASLATSSFGFTGGPVSYVAEVGAAKGYFPAVLSTTYGSNSYNEVAIQKLNASAGESTEYSYVGGDGSATTHSFSISGSGDSTVVAVTSDTNRFAGVADGGTVNTDTAGALPQGVDTLYIGSFKNSYGHINTNVKRIAVYGEALSDTNLQALTS